MDKRSQLTWGEWASPPCRNVSCGHEMARQFSIRKETLHGTRRDRSSAMPARRRLILGDELEVVTSCIVDVLMNIWSLAKCTFIKSKGCAFKFQLHRILKFWFDCLFSFYYCISFLFIIFSNFIIAYHFNFFLFSF